MNPNSQTTIYDMVGPMGSGKTTLALKISKEKNAVFCSLDGTIKSFNQPVIDLKSYEYHMKAALEILSAQAIELLKKGQSVVFDFGGGIGHWPWLKNIADAADTKIEIFHFEIPTAERWRRVQKRNEEKTEGAYHFTMSKEEFDNQKTHRELPPVTTGLKIIKIIE